MTPAPAPATVPAMRDEFENYRIRSTRGYRRLIDRATREVLLGKRPAADLAAITAAAKTGAELFMTEKVLERGGLDHEVEHKLGQDGGLEVPAGTKIFRRKKVVVKTGIDKQGARVDDKSVSIETSAEDKEVDTEAESETL